MFGPINLFDGGTLAISPAGDQQMGSLVISSGSIEGAGQAAESATIVTRAAIVTLKPSDLLVLSGDLGGEGSALVAGPGTVVFSGTNSYTGGTEVESGALLVTNAYSLPADGSLTVGAGSNFIFDPTATIASVAASPSAAASAVPEPSTLILLGVASSA